MYDYVGSTRSGHDTSYGAVCTLKSGREMMLCNDRMPGYFTCTGRIPRTAKGIEAFIAGNCPPSG